MTANRTTPDDHLPTCPILQAELAAARGDVEAAERRTGLAERQAGLFSRLPAELRRASVDVAAAIATQQAGLTTARRPRLTLPQAPHTRSGQET